MRVTKDLTRSNKLNNRNKGSVKFMNVQDFYEI